MLRHYRRLWGVAIWAVLLVPLAVMLLFPATATIDRREMRTLAPWPALPEGRGAWKRLPGRLNSYLADHFGLRQPLLRAEALIAQGLLRNGNDQVLFGHDGWLFYRLEDGLRRSAGELVQEARVTETADTVARVASALAALNVRFLVAVPPSPSTIYDGELPEWARNRGRPTEYDKFLEALSARGVQAVDLRPSLRAAARHDQVYFQHDTHWNKLGALEAFNVVAEAAGHSDWRLDPAKALVPSIQAGGGLVRMLGLDDLFTEPAPALREPRADREVPVADVHARAILTADHDGPTVLVIGDSFTRAFFAPMVLVHAGRYAWIPNGNCTVDWHWVESVGADEVWWMPTERLLLCGPGMAPPGLDSPVANRSRSG